MNIEQHKQFLRRHLEDIKRPINAEIRNYPLPAAGCDAQYNHLIGERGRLARELSRLDAIDQAGEIDEFITCSAYIDDQAALNIRRKLSA